VSERKYGQWLAVKCVISRVGPFAKTYLAIESSQEGLRLIESVAAPRFSVMSMETATDPPECLATTDTRRQFVVVANDEVGCADRWCNDLIEAVAFIDVGEANLVGGIDGVITRLSKHIVRLSD
jgi:hypothetical protein